MAFGIMTGSGWQERAMQGGQRLKHASKLPPAGLLWQADASYMDFGIFSSGVNDFAKTSRLVSRLLQSFWNMTIWSSIEGVGHVVRHIFEPLTLWLVTSRTGSSKLVPKTAKS